MSSAAPQPAAILPAAPPSILPVPPRPDPAARVMPRQVPATLVKTLFDAPPASTVSARAAIDRARVNLQASTRSISAARQSALELQKLMTEDPAAAAIAQHEGLSPDVVSKFLKLSEPLIAAFVPAA